MSGPLTVNDGALLVKDPSDISVYTFDWDNEHLALGVTIASQTTTVTGLSGDITTTPLTVSTSSPLGIQALSRTVKLKLSAGALESKWRVDQAIVTSETPAQTKERSFYVRIETR